MVFRNDPLESLKVSSTFDSIPFVREYLQKEIEGQLRTLLMDEVPAIIHRLSLRLWVPEYQAREDEEPAKHTGNPFPEGKATDPLASPPQDPVDLSGHALDAMQIASLSLDSGSDTHSLFSQRTLLRLGVLTNSQRTLSLFTPNIRDAVFRAWAGPTERGERFGSNPPVTPMMSRAHSYVGSTSSTSTTYVFSHNSEGVHPIRQPLLGYGSAASGLGIGASRHAKPHGGRKRKHRVVNLRAKGLDKDDLVSMSGDGSTISGTDSCALSDSGLTEEREELQTPPRSPKKAPLRADFDNIDLGDTQIRERTVTPLWDEPNASTPKPSITPQSPAGPAIQPDQYPSEKPQPDPFLSNSASISQGQPFLLPLAYSNSQPHTGILEQAWVMRMAGEFARHVHDQKVANNGFWDRGEMETTPPPAYGP